MLNGKSNKNKVLSVSIK